MKGKTKGAHANDLKLAEIEKWEISEVTEAKRLI